MLRLRAAPPFGWSAVTLISLGRRLLSSFPQAQPSIDFAIPTSAVSVATRVIIETGTDVDGYRAPQTWLNVTPPGSPTPPSSLSSLTLSSSTVLSGGTVTGTLAAHFTGSRWRRSRHIARQHGRPGDRSSKHYDSRRQHQRHFYHNARARDSVSALGFHSRSLRDIRRIAGANPRNRSRSRPGHVAGDRSLLVRI